MGAYTCQVGTAVVGRGELGFVQIQTRLSQGILGTRGAVKTEAAFGAIVWALLIASLVGPVLFRFALKLKPQGGVPGQDAFVLASDPSEQQGADMEGGLPRLLNNTTTKDVGLATKLDKFSDVPATQSTQV